MGAEMVVISGYGGGNHDRTFPEKPFFSPSAISLMKMTTHMLPLAAESLQPWMRPDGREIAMDGLTQQQNGTPRPSLRTLGGPMAWSGLDFDREKLHVLELSRSQIAEIEGTLKSFRSRGMDGDEVRRECFPLPSLQGRLDQCALEIHHGSGMCIIRGLNPEDYSVEDNIILFLGLADYIGDQRGVQSTKGAMLSHVTESKSWVMVPRVRRHGIHTNSSLPYHTDMGCEILSMQVRDCAEEGGHTCVASISAIYNELLESNPQVLHILARPDWPIQVSRLDPPYVLCPLVEFHEGKLVISMDPARIGPHPSSGDGDDVPRLKPEQEAALAVLQAAARKHRLRLETRPGDIVFLNNLALLHGRESYQDSASSTRHLVRLWLRNSQLGWHIPASMRMPWDAAFGDRARKVINKRYAVMPMPEYIEAKYSNGTAAFVADDDEDDEDNDNNTGELTSH
ncbi:Clavaminate synthase-like protein [Whalleya microplaca]|nr:Clavaminate synthase-like protein [Whalleya microplaca]